MAGTSSLEALLELHEEVVALVELRLAAACELETNARSQLESYIATRRQLEDERANLNKTAAIYRKEMDAPVNALAPTNTLPTMYKTRARIGPQRYRMLCILKARGQTSFDDLISATGFSSRRIRDQMQADTAIKVVFEANGLYNITEYGIDLLRRFEESRQIRGIPLPPLEGQIGDDDDQQDAYSDDPIVAEHEKFLARRDA